MYFLDLRGISQEVSLVTKHGVETKNYDTVSILVANRLILNYVLNIFNSLHIIRHFIVGCINSYFISLVLLSVK